MQIELMKLQDLKPADYNPRVNLEPGMDEYEKLKQSSIDEYKKIIRVALGKWLKNLYSGQTNLDKVSDLKILIEADLMPKDIDND